MIEPISILSNVSGTITVAVTVSNVVLGLRNCPEEIKTCFSLVNTVNADIQHAVALRTKLRKILIQKPVEAKRIDDIITSASESLTSIGTLVERLRADAYGGKVPLPQRLRWVLGDKESFALRTRDLQAQHMAVGGEIQWMRGLEMIVPLYAKAEPATSFDNLDLWKSKEKDFESYSNSPTAPKGHGLDPVSAHNENSFSPVRRAPEPPLPPLPTRGVFSSETLVGSVIDAASLQIGEYASHRTEPPAVAPELPPPPPYVASSHVEYEEHIFPEVVVEQTSGLYVWPEPGTKSAEKYPNPENRPRSRSETYRDSGYVPRMPLDPSLYAYPEVVTPQHSQSRSNAQSDLFPAVPPKIPHEIPSGLELAPIQHSQTHPRSHSSLTNYWETYRDPEPTPPGRPRSTITTSKHPQLSPSHLSQVSLHSTDPFQRRHTLETYSRPGFSTQNYASQSVSSLSSCSELPTQTPSPAGMHPSWNNSCVSISEMPTLASSRAEMSGSTPYQTSPTGSTPSTHTRQSAYRAPTSTENIYGDAFARPRDIAADRERDRVPDRDGLPRKAYGTRGAVDAGVDADADDNEMAEFFKMWKEDQEEAKLEQALEKEVQKEMERRRGGGGRSGGGSGGKRLR